MSEGPAQTPVLEVCGVTKRFGPVVALRDVSLRAYEGEIVGLIGVNGAGKSTLLNILDGVLSPTEGDVLIRGQTTRFDNPKQARKAGIGFIHQHSTAFSELSVAENISIQADCLGSFSRKRIEERAKALLEKLGVGHINPRRKLRTLPVGERQSVDVARALISDPPVLLFDEPTSSLTRAEAQHLFEVIRSLREDGRTIFYTSHFLDDVLDLADRVIVLRDGQVVMNADREGLTREDLVSAMLSRRLKDEVTLERPAVTGPIVLTIKDLKPEFGEPVSFFLRRGEVLGIWGLLGSGRTEIFRAMLGLDPATYSEITYSKGDGASRSMKPKAMLREVGFVTEDRHHDGLYMSLPIWQNLTSASIHAFTGLFGRMRRDDEVRAARDIARRLSIKIGDENDLVSSLSGGNQQKVVLGRWLVKAPQIYLLDEPTHGVDVGAKAQIHDIIHKVADNGSSVVVISSEVEEMFTLADRILVLRDGKFTSEMMRVDFSEQRLLSAS
jgi:ABC-type sugar transport system ATPase subunit